MSESDMNVYVCDQVKAVRELHADLLTTSARELPIAEQLDRQARRILQAHQEGNQTVVTHIQCWHPILVGRDAKAIMRYQLTLDDARQTIAREYGFDDWAAVKALGEKPSDLEFESAVDLLLLGDATGLQSLLERNPEITRLQSRFGHRSTLLHYVGSNGIETHRQVVPHNLAEVTKVVLSAGADVNAVAEMYGGGCTTIALVITSAHPAEAGVVDEVVKLLIDAGAETDGS